MLHSAVPQSWLAALVDFLHCLGPGSVYSTFSNNCQSLLIFALSQVMNYLLSDRVGAEKNDDWLEYFDVVITGRLRSEI